MVQNFSFNFMNCVRKSSYQFRRQEEEEERKFKTVENNPGVYASITVKVIYIQKNYCQLYPAVFYTEETNHKEQ